MTNDEIDAYYASLLIIQYVGMPKANATIQATADLYIMNQLPNQVQNAYTIGDTVLNGTLYPGAVGVQLDVLGKYVGVIRSGVDLNGNPITLNDQDFTKLIQIATVTNNSGSSLYDIQNLLHQYFANEIFVYDGVSSGSVMQMSYLITASVGSQTLVELFVTEGLLPKPMGVQLSQIVYVPSVSLFGLQSYDNVAPDYSSATNYALGARVLSNGIVYASLKNANLNNPVTDTTSWVAIIYPANSYSTYPIYEPYTWLSYNDTINIL